MCGRITQKSDLACLGLGLTTMTLIDPLPPRYNGAPGQDHWVIRQHPKTGERTLDRLWWGLIPHWVADPKGGRKPINAKAETVASLPTFRDAYARRRCLLPIDNFFEWAKVKGRGPKQPYAVAMKTGEPFALGGVWESWRHPETGEIVRTFCIITTPANEMVKAIHDRMPLIIAPDAYDRWLANIEPDTRDLLVPYPSEPMTMWPRHAGEQAGARRRRDPGAGCRRSTAASVGFFQWRRRSSGGLERIMIRLAGTVKSASRTRHDRRALSRQPE